MAADLELRGLVIRAPFVDWILDGLKSWELRGSATHVRGTIALIAAGSGTVVGTCDLVECLGPLRVDDLRRNAGKLNRRADDFAAPLHYGENTHAWVLSRPRRLPRPVRYVHPAGAVIWVRLGREVAARIADSANERSTADDGAPRAATGLVDAPSEGAHASTFRAHGGTVAGPPKGEVMSILGEATVGGVRENGQLDFAAAAVERVTGVSAQQARARIAEAHGRTKLRTLFDAEWPSSAARLGSLTVGVAREFGFQEEIRSVLGATNVLVSRRLNAAAGNTLVRNIFRDEWPEEQARPSSPRPRDAATARARSSEPGASPRESLSVAEITDVLRTEPNIRGRTFRLPARPFRDVQPLFLHQQNAIDKIDANQWASGIVHLPTGAGKTRVALELVRRALRERRNARVIWATHGVWLLRQSMIRLAEAQEAFEREVRFSWLKHEQVNEPEILENLDVAFVTRDALTQWIGHASGRRPNALHAAFRYAPGETPLDITLVYDESHELGADKLQKEWASFHERVIEPGRRGNFRVFGLSATPLPTQQKAHDLLKRAIFPIGTLKSAREWPLLVHHSVTMKELIDTRVLCPINLAHQHSGKFDIPAALIEEATGEATDELKRFKGSKRTTSADAVDFARIFNRRVMSHVRVVRFLGERIAERLPQLGKTIVFSPTIQAANILVDTLRNHANVGTGLVSVVHSAMEDPDLASAPDTGVRATLATRPEVQVQEFIARGARPCVMVNVGMLTTGFDDPQVRTIVLARLTTSTNLFWQMIGRGLRGPSAGGTPDCFVIDPIRLTEAFRVFEGYRPNLEGASVSQGGEDEIGRPDEASEPSVVETPPAPTPATPFDQAVRRSVREALIGFLRGEASDIPTVVQALMEVDLTFEKGELRFENVAPGTTPRNLASSLRARVEQLRDRLGASDFGWAYGLIPPQLSQAAIRSLLTKLKLIEDHRILTADEFHDYEASRLSGPPVAPAAAPGARDGTRATTSTTSAGASRDRLFDRYEILSEIRGGGMSEGFKVRDDQGRICFLKRVKSTGVDAAALRREREIYIKLDRAAASNVLQVYEIEDDATHLGLVTEFADGGTLADHIKRKGGRLGSAETRAVAQAVVHGLRELHAANIVHRDVKPDNVFLAGGSWKLGDFGISKNLARLVTQNRTFQGHHTPGFAPPEQVVGSEAHVTNDIYALGKLICACLTGSTDVDLLTSPQWSHLVRRCTERAQESRAGLDEIEAALASVDE